MALLRQWVEAGGESGLRGGPGRRESPTDRHATPVAALLRADRCPDGLPIGQAFATTAGKLRARWVIHSVGPVWSEREDRSALLVSCYRTSLQVADEISAASVAFPAVYRSPLKDAAR